MKAPIARRLKSVNADPDVELLYDRVNRAKHRWLKRVMYSLAATSSEKCFAYLIMDHLNCVSLDSWPSQKTIADRLKWSIKTVHRVAFALSRRGYLRISRSTRGSYRYAPIFLPEDEDKSGTVSRHVCPRVPDRNVEESFLLIQPKQSFPSPESQTFAGPRYETHRRGQFEAELAKQLGNDGFDILARLSEHDDAIVERLCRACANGEVGERELAAARLVAAQLGQTRRRK